MWPDGFWLETWNVLREAAIFVVGGLLIAALLHAWLSGGRAAALLSRRGTRSVVWATLIGAPLPLCSCSVLPAAMTLRRRGASKGAVLSFLISTPETSIQSVLLTYGLLGPLLAIVRPVTACVTALVAGIVQNLIERRRPTTDAEDPTRTDEPDLATHVHELDASSRGGLRDGLRFAFVDLLDDISGWILLSVLIAAAINVYFAGWVASPALANPWIAMAVMLAIGIPLYVCAEASTPIAAALIANGISPGAALVFLLVGPATNLGSIAVLLRQIGRRAVIVYLSSIAIVTVAAGVALDRWPARWGPARGIRVLDEPYLPDSIKTAGAIIFLAMCAASLLRQGWAGRLAPIANRLLSLNWSPSAATRVVVLLVLGAYVLSGFAIVQPDERGLVLRFGKRVGDPVPPGLYWTGPWPIGSMQRIAVERVRREVFGVAPAGASTLPADVESTTWQWLGDENIASVRYATHWSVEPQRLLDFAFGFRDVDGFVRAATRAACREVLSRATIDGVYTTDRPAAESRIRDVLQRHCDAAGSGVRIDDFRFLDVHAPPEVHDAFRDVASALEDRAAQIDMALAHRAGLIPVARGNAAAARTSVQAEADRTRRLARAEADVFRRVSEAARRFAQVTRVRLYHEMLDQVLPRVRKYLRVDRAGGRPLELWVRPAAREELPIPSP